MLTWRNDRIGEGLCGSALKTGELCVGVAGALEAVGLPGRVTAPAEEGAPFGCAAAVREGRRIGRLGQWRGPVSCGGALKGRGPWRRRYGLDEPVKLTDLATAEGLTRPAGMRLIAGHKDEETKRRGNGAERPRGRGDNSRSVHSLKLARYRL